jgi:hypothetical protein
MIAAPSFGGTIALPANSFQACFNGMSVHCSTFDLTNESLDFIGV